MTPNTSRRTERRRLYRSLIALQTRVIRAHPTKPGVFFHYPPFQTQQEERVNAMTHGVAAVASVLGSIWLVIDAVRGGSLMLAAGCAAYCASLTAVFTMSALSHLPCPPRLRQMFRTLDQAAIYLLIAGSCTPYFMRFLSPNGWGWMLPVVWGAAILGAWSKVRGVGVNSVSMWLYVPLGWFPALAMKPFFDYMPLPCFSLVIATGALYMAGVGFLICDERYRYFHAVWHVCVMAASLCTFLGVALYIV